jgi:hypothetical protein
MWAKRGEVPVMPSARILPFPRSARRHPVPPRRTPSPRPAQRSAWFVPLLAVTLLLVFLYLTRVAGTPRDNALYGLLLSAVWGLYFSYDWLLRLPRLGPLLRSFEAALTVGAVFSLLHFLLWLVWSNP